MKSVLNVHWKDWYWSWSCNTLATWCEELTHFKRSWYWEILKARGEGDDRGWDRWMASPTQWTWVWISSRSWWWTRKPGMLQLMGHKESDMTEQLNWTEGLDKKHHKTECTVYPRSSFLWSLLLNKRAKGFSKVIQLKKHWRETPRIQALDHSFMSLGMFPYPRIPPSIDFLAYKMSYNPSW